MIQKFKKLDERGFYLIEVMLSIALLSVALGSAVNSQNAISSTRGQILRRVAATRIATEKMEIIASLNPDSLDDSDDESNTAVTSGNFNFTRSTDVTTNSDGSVTVAVSVATTASAFPVTINIENTFSKWGNL